MDSRRVLTLVLIVLGILAAIVGVMYLVVPSESLPSFFPGHLAGVHGKHTNRGGAALALGVVLLVAGAVAGYKRRSLYPR